MNEPLFFNWLCSCFKGGTPSSRLSNCKRVELYEGDLDSHFFTDQGHALINKLSYSIDDQRNNRKAKHSIPISGDLYNGSATLKQAVKLYFDFKSGTIAEEKTISTDKTLLKKLESKWPIWDSPSDDELYELVNLSAKYIKFLNVDIVKALVDDNNKHKNEWIEILQMNEINPEIYLWENSPCAFPGVRRYSGSKEIASFRKHIKLTNSDFHNAIKLDDNDFPKHIWSFTFRGKLFQKKGPANYSLAHLADHKEYKNRLFSEFTTQFKDKKHELFGLFTCPTNTVYIPTSLIRPTDFSPTIRKLLISKANALYGNVCNLLPSWVRIDSNQIDKWHHTNFQWSEPVGQIENMKLFLDYRNKTLRQWGTHKHAQENSEA